MLLNELFKNNKQTLVEGGNVKIGDIEANRIDSTKRPQVVPIIDQALRAINNSFKNFTNGTPLWSDELLASKKFLSGSAFHFFNVPKSELTESTIPTADFAAVKKTVGDIDTQVDRNLKDQITAWLNSLSAGDRFGPAIYVGAKSSGEQFITLWTFPDIVMTDDAGRQVPTNIQIDLELKQFENDEPTPWSRFSASSEWEDLSRGVKGVFHKYLVQSLAVLTREDFMLRKLKGRAPNKVEVDVPTTDNMVSFAVSSKEGGGLRRKYEPVLDADGNQVKVDGLKVYNALPTTGYEQDIGKIFTTLFNKRLKPEQYETMEKLFWSFTGLLKVIDRVLDEQDQQKIIEAFALKLFDKAAQGLYKNDPVRDVGEKSVALDIMIEELSASAPIDIEALKQAYFDNYPIKESVNENDSVVASKRQGIVHLEKMKDSDFLDFLEDLKRSSDDQFTLENIDINVKIDGLGGRFGKDRGGRPFFESSRSGPVFEPGTFSAFQEKNNVTDPVLLQRAAHYDKLFDEVMTLISRIDSELGADFLVDTKIHAEFLYAPMAEKVNDKLKFVSVEYDQFPAGTDLVVVPLFAEQASTGSDLNRSDAVIKQLKQLKQQGNARFVDNRAFKTGAVNVSAALAPLDNINELRAKISTRKRADLAEVKHILEPIKHALAKEIIEHPELTGKEVLGKDYEGIILNTKRGPIKITSPAFKAKMAEKLANQRAANNATSKRVRPAVVTAGSFVGHRGHQQLVDQTIAHAKQIGGDPYIYISAKVGPDDPIPPEVKLATWKKLYPEYKDSFKIISSPDGTNPSPVKKIEKELVLPADSPYNKIVLIVGADRYDGFKKWMDTLEKRMKDPVALAKYGGTQNEVEFETIRSARDESEGGTGISFTQLRNALKNNSLSDKEKLAKWMQGFDGAKLGQSWISKLMQIAKENMGLSEEAAGVGKVTAQNTTADVGPGTLRKNLKAFKLVKEQK